MTGKKNKGFTLAELLVVVAIIAVLVAMAIPVFSAQQEKAREGVDLANIRTVYAEVSVEALTAGSATPKTVNLKQQKAGWQTESATDTLAGLTKGSDYLIGAPVDGDGNTATVEWVAETSRVKITFAGPGGPLKYNFGDARGEIMNETGRALTEMFTNLLEGPHAQKVKDWNGTSTAGRTDGIKYREIPVSYLMDPTRECYRDANNTSYKWKDLLEEIGVDDTMLTQEKIDSLGSQSLIFLNDDCMPCAVGYYVTGNSGAYRISYFEGDLKGKTLEFPSIGDRHKRVYDQSVGAAEGTVVK